MKSKSAQAKGDRFENYLLERLRKEIDVNTHRSIGSGNGLDKHDIRIPVLNIEIEAKNADSFNLKADWDQVEKQLTTGNVGVLAVRHPYFIEFKKTLIVMDLEDWIVLLQGQGIAREIVVQDPKMKYAIGRMIEAAKSVLKHYE